MSKITEVNKIEPEPYVNNTPEGEFEGKKVLTRKPSNKRVDEVKTQIVPSIPAPEDSSVKFGIIRRTKSEPAYKSSAVSKRLIAAQRLMQPYMDILEPLNIEQPSNVKSQPSQYSEEDIIILPQGASEQGQDEEA